MSRQVILVGALLLFCGVSLILKENYPFSHFPMYSDPSPKRYYYWLADAEGNALPVLDLTGKTAAQMGKILRSNQDKRMAERKVKRDNLTAEDVGVICTALLTFLRSESANAKQSLPEKLAIMRTDIEYKDGKVAEVASVYFSEAKGGQP